MNPSPDITATFTRAARECFAEGLTRIEHCVGQLTNEQVWWRPRDGMNSVANLLLHLSGNVRQWIISGVGGVPDVRDRPAEFADTSRRPKAELLDQLRRTIRDADQVLARQTGAQLLAPRRIQGFDTTGLQAIFDTAAHFRGHIQEIIHLTREQLGDRYQYHWVPEGPEQTSGGQS